MEMNRNQPKTFKKRKFFRGLINVMLAKLTSN